MSVDTTIQKQIPSIQSGQMAYLLADHSLCGQRQTGVTVYSIRNPDGTLKHWAN
jgi:hypothetical protein